VGGGGVRDMHPEDWSEGERQGETDSNYLSFSVLLLLSDLLLELTLKM